MEVAVSLLIGQPMIFFGEKPGTALQRARPLSFH